MRALGVAVWHCGQAQAGLEHVQDAPNAISTAGSLEKSRKPSLGARELCFFNCKMDTYHCCKVVVRIR